MAKVPTSNNGSLVDYGAWGQNHLQGSFFKSIGNCDYSSSCLEIVGSILLLKQSINNKYRVYSNAFL